MSQISLAGNFYGGPKESRTPDLHCAKVALYQLSYGPRTSFLKSDYYLINNFWIESELLCYEVKFSTSL